MPNQITAWSYSRYSVYVKCPRQFKYKFIDKLQEPESPAMARGDFLHKALQAYIEGKARTLRKDAFGSVGPLKEELAKLRKDKAQCELELAVDREWRPVSWFDRSTYLRAKLDAQVAKDPRHVRVIDHKSGKEYPEAHADQLEIYAAVVYAHQPRAEEITAEMFYLDLGKRVPVVFTDLARTVPKIRKKWERRAAPIFKDTKWQAKPSRECNWCAFSSRKGGPCDKG